METEHLGLFVAQRRKALGESQNDLANHVHYTNQSISSFEKGETSPSIAILPSLADFLQLSLDDLIAQNPSPAPFSSSNPPFEDEKIKRNLVALRRNKGYSQSEEGKRIGVSRRTVIHYENGSSIPSLEVLTAILKVYQISCSSFFYEELGEKLTPMPEKGWSVKTKVVSFFIAGFLVGGGLLSAILIPLGSFGSKSPASSSGAYEQQSTTGAASSSENNSSSPIPGLEKLVVITTNGKARTTNLTAGESVTFTLYAEPTFDFVSPIQTAYSLTWSIKDYGEDVSGLSLSEATPYPCETLSSTTAAKSATIDIAARVQSIKDPSIYFDAEAITVTIHAL
jgi:transcriptional regulator with XRE-family HTH domain